MGQCCCQSQRPRILDDELSARGYSSVLTFADRFNTDDSADSTNVVTTKGNSTLIVYIKQTHVLIPPGIQPKPCKAPIDWTEYPLVEVLTIGSVNFKFFRYEGDVFVSIRNNPGKVKLILGREVVVRSQTAHFVVRLEETFAPSASAPLGTASPGSVRLEAPPHHNYPVGAPPHHAFHVGSASPQAFPAGSAPPEAFPVSSMNFI